MGGEPANTAAEWFAGKNEAPKTVKLVPEKKAKKTGGLGALSKLGGAAAAKTDDSKGEDTAALKAEIEALKAELAAAKTSGAPAESSEDMSSKPILGYWAIRGLAQNLKTMFAYCGVEYEDK